MKFQRNIFLGGAKIAAIEGIFADVFKNKTDTLVNNSTITPHVFK